MIENLSQKSELKEVDTVINQLPRDAEKRIMEKANKG